MKNKCPKCGTVINDPYTENLRCICTKHNCKYEFKKELQGIIGVTLKRGTENYQGKNGDCDFILTDEEPASWKISPNFSFQSTSYFWI